MWLLNRLRGILARIMTVSFAAAFILYPPILIFEREIKKKVGWFTTLLDAQNKANKAAFYCIYQVLILIWAFFFVGQVFSFAILRCHCKERWGKAITMSLSLAFVSGLFNPDRMSFETWNVCFSHIDELWMALEVFDLWLYLPSISLTLRSLCTQEKRPTKTRKKLNANVEMEEKMSETIIQKDHKGCNLNKYAKINKRDL